MSAQKRKPQLNSEQLRNRLKLRSQLSETKLLQSHQEAKKFYEKVHLRPGKIRQHAARLITSGALAGSLLLSSHVAAGPVAGKFDQFKSAAVDFTLAQLDLAQNLQNILPSSESWTLNSSQEEKISQLIKNVYGVSAVPELDGNRLNNDYGRMGAEQHLPRYPGDSVYERDELQEKGITPGLGAWGYFASSKSEMTPELYDTEKWYVAVQTLYLPNWNTDTARLSGWYKYRHVVVVNPENGKAVVAAVADSGPSQFTGKQFGGSPKLMEYLNINTGMQNHPVVLFFLDDPNKEVPLGPLEYNMERDKSNMTNKT